MSLPELQALATSVRVAPLAPVQTARCATLPKYGTTCLVAFQSASAGPAEQKPVRRRFTGRRSA